MSENDATVPPRINGDASEPAPACERTQGTAQGNLEAKIDGALRAELIAEARDALDGTIHVVESIYGGMELNLDTEAIANEAIDTLIATITLGCDCPMDPHHRWNCPVTPIWAQTIRDLDTNPWTVVTNAMRPTA